jgi:hypothetical protein
VPVDMAEEVLARALEPRAVGVAVRSKRKVA